MIWIINQLGLLNLKYNKLKQNRPNGNDWGDNEKILININEIWVSDISEIDNRMVNTFEMDNRRFDAMRGVVRFIKAQITSVDLTETNLCHYCAHFSNFIFMLT